MESNRGEQIPNKAGEGGRTQQHASRGTRPAPLLWQICVQPQPIPADNPGRMARSGAKIHREEAQASIPKEMSKNAPENGAFYSINTLTFLAGCDNVRVSKRKHATLTIRNTKKMSGRPSFKEMSDVAQCIESEVKCRTTKEAKTQATHQRVALFMGSGWRKNESAIKTPSDEPVGAQRLKRPRSTEQAHYLTSRLRKERRKEVEMTSQDKQQYKKLMSYSKSELIAIIRNDDHIIAELNNQLKGGR